MGTHDAFLSFRLEPDLLDLIKDEAKRDGVSMSAVVRAAFEDWMKERQQSRKRARRASKKH